MAYINGKEILFSAVLNGVDQSEVNALNEKNNKLTNDLIAIVQGDSAEITLPEGIETIREYAFYRHPMTGVIIPASVTKIERVAFRDCANCLAYDFANHTAVPVMAENNAFTNINENAKIKVPSALYSEWIAATNWATYASYIYKKISPDDIVYTPATDVNNTATAGVAIRHPFYFGVCEPFTRGKRYVDYEYLAGDSVKTETYELTDTGAVDSVGNTLITLSGNWDGDRYEENGVVIQGTVFSGNITFAKAGTYRLYQKFIDEAGDEYSTAAYVYEVN